MCQLSEDRNIRNIPSVTKDRHTNRLASSDAASSFLLLLYKFPRIHSPVLHMQKNMPLNNPNFLLIRVAMKRASGYVPSGQREEKLPLTKKKKIQSLSTEFTYPGKYIYGIDNLV